MSKYKMICVDLDGTLLTSKKTILSETLRKINNLPNFNCEFTISTGRPYDGVKTVINGINIPINLILYNGTKIISSDNEVIQDLYLKKEVVLNIVNIINDKNGSFCAYINDELYVNRIDEYTERYINIINKKHNLINSVSHLDLDHVSKIIWFNEGDEHIKNQNSILKDLKGASFFTSNIKYLEFVHEGVSKGASVERLAKYKNIDLKDIISIGDGFNDLSMIEISGLGVAMANSKDEIKNRSHTVTLNDNNHDGVGEIIDKYIIGGRNNE